MEKSAAERLQEWLKPYAPETIHVHARTVLLEEGELARRIYFVQEGCLRIWLNSDGKEITNQFFFEGSMVASLESFLTEQLSAYTLETIESCTLLVLEKQQFDLLMQTDPAFKDWFNQRILDRFLYYSRHLLSFLKDKPETRYAQLIEHSPQIIRRVPQHYIASYLGITAVSLSRIRSKSARQG